MLLRNPCEDIDAPKIERREMKVWDIATTATALELVRPWRVHIPVVLAVLCGLRRGEIAALRWRHADPDRAQLGVVESAEQTKAGVRARRLRVQRAAPPHRDCRASGVALAAV